MFNLGLSLYFYLPNQQLGLSLYFYSPNRQLGLSLYFYLPNRQLGLSLYFSDIQISTTEAFSTASAMADRVDPPILSISIHTSKPSC